MKNTITLDDVVNNGLEQIHRGEPLEYPVVRQTRWDGPLPQIRELMADVRFLRDWNRSGLGGNPEKAQYYQEALVYLQQVVQDKTPNIRKGVLQ